MMGGKTARNMYSADNYKEHCVSCILLVIYNTHLATRGYMDVKLKLLCLVVPICAFFVPLSDECLLLGGLTVSTGKAS
jgi:hypothetical protein